MTIQKGSASPNYRHGGRVEHRPEYNSWSAMRQRCNKPSYWCYHRYGGRGISVCDRWNDSRNGFANFLSDMGKKPSLKHSIDRINLDGDYTPENCRWSTQREQAKYTSKSRYYTVDGVTDTLTEHSRRYGIKVMSVKNRIALGWSPEDAFKTPLNPSGVRFTSQEVSRPECLSCGKACRTSVNKFCSRDCYFYHRWGSVHNG